MSEPPISFVLETNRGGAPVMVCACGVLVLHGMADAHVRGCVIWGNAQLAAERPAGSALSEDPQADAMIEALTDCVNGSYEQGEQDGGFVAYYVTPTGPIHRAMALLPNARPRPDEVMPDGLRERLAAHIGSTRSAPTAAEKLWHEAEVAAARADAPGAGE